jgi:hypothetical protein
MAEGGKDSHTSIHDKRGKISMQRYTGVVSGQ